MSGEAKIEVSGVTIRIPMKLRRHGGRKLVIAPDGLVGHEAKPKFDEVLINALVRAHRWRRQIDSGEFRSASELAAHEKITDSFVVRMLTLTLLAPDITQAIAAGDHPVDVTATRLMQALPLPLDWAEQRKVLGMG